MLHVAVDHPKMNPLHTAYRWLSPSMVGTMHCSFKIDDNLLLILSLSEYDQGQIMLDVG
jgi:hypothetical protein